MTIDATESGPVLGPELMSAIHSSQPLAAYSVPLETLQNGHGAVTAIPLSTTNSYSAPPAPKPAHAHKYDTKVPVVDRCVDEPRQLHIAVVGGGLAGVLCGILFPAKAPGVQVTIYEKNHDFGGIWLENVYPGLRCDIPSHVYQATFAPKTDWSDEFAPGHEILEYWQALARKHDVYRVAKFQHRVESTTWEPRAGKWLLKAKKLTTGETINHEYDAVVSCIGRFNDWRLPVYPGMADYTGLLRHTSNWDSSFDPSGKSVAVIGNGASGIQLTTHLQSRVSRLDHYARNKTWIAASAAGDDRKLEMQPISESQKQALEDPNTYLAYRKGLEDKYWRDMPSYFRGTKQNAHAKDELLRDMKMALAAKPELFENMIPEFSPNCRRVTPSPGYLEAITEPNVNYIQSPIRRFTATGIETADGNHRQVDAVFCATGASSDLLPPFAISAHGRQLSDVWGEDGEHGFPYTYIGLATPGFPNMFFVNGPFATGPSGTVLQSIETQLTYIAKLLRKMAREGIKAAEPSSAATDDFIQYSDAFFNTTVLSDNCSSWYNGGREGGRIHGVWPGSGGHLAIVRREPRWEDWDYKYMSDTGNRFLWFLGNGCTKKEADPTSDMTSYLKSAEHVDLREIHETWWELP